MKRAGMLNDMLVKSPERHELPKRLQNRQKTGKNGSKVAESRCRYLIIKHLCNKTLAFESSASASSATPAGV